MVDGLLHWIHSMNSNYGVMGYRFPAPPTHSTHLLQSNLSSSITKKRIKLKKVKGRACLLSLLISEGRAAEMELMIELTEWKGAAQRSLRLITNKRREEKEEANPMNQTQSIVWFMDCCLPEEREEKNETKRKGSLLRSNNQLFFSCGEKKSLILLWLAAQRGCLVHRLFSLHSLCCFHYWFHQYFQSTAARENCATFSSCSANQLNQLFFFCFLFLAEPHAACGGHNPPIKRKEKQLISLIFFAASLAPFKRN